MRTETVLFLVRTNYISSEIIQTYHLFTWDLNLHRLSEIKRKVKGDNVDGTVAEKYLIKI